MKNQEEVSIRFHVELDEGADESAVQKLLQEKLAVLSEVDECQVEKEEVAAGGLLEVASAISVTVTLLREVPAVIEATTRIVRALKELLAEIRGVKGAKMEVDVDLRELDQVNEADVETAVTAQLA